MEPALTTESALGLAELHEKMDRLAVQVEFLSLEAERQRRRQQEWEELKDDLTLIMNDVFRLGVRELEEIENYVQIEDIVHTFKRMLRNTRNLEQMLGQLESMMELWRDINPLSRDVFLAIINRLEEMESKGYFSLMREGGEVLDQMVLSLKEEDLSQLKENIPLIVDTLKTVNQPETIGKVRDMATVLDEDESDTPSLFGLLRELNDPAVRRGLNKALRITKALSENGAAG